MPGFSHAPGHPEQKACDILEYGKEEKHDEGGIQRFCDDEYSQGKVGPEEGTSDSFIKDILLTDGQQHGGKASFDERAYLQRQNKA